MSAALRVIGREEVGPITGQLVDRSGTITAGGTSQKIAEKWPERSYFVFQNHSDTDMWIQFGGAAVADQPSIKVGAGIAYTPSFVDVRDIWVICATTGKKFTCKEG